MKLPTVSGNELVKIAIKLGFEIRRQRGSHIILKKMKKAREGKIRIGSKSRIMNAY